MKKFLLIMAAVAILLIPASVSAKTTADQRAAKTAAFKAIKLQAKQDRTQIHTAAQVAKWIRVGDNKIVKDITGLNKLVIRANAKTTLAADTKATLVASMQADIATLTALRTKIDAETTLVAVKADIKLITTLGLINGKYLPMINSRTAVTSATATAR